LINFDSKNASIVITEKMPWLFHERYFLISSGIIMISLVAFVGSYYEINVLLNINTFLSLVAIICLILLAVSNEVTSNMIIDVLEENDNSKCVFVIP
jgi:amino acid transporter